MIADKIANLKKTFEGLSQEEKYEALMKLGRTLPSFPENHKTPKNRVNGCQSILYLHTEHQDGRLFFTAQTDALISAGLAALLISVYSGEPAEIILKHEPTFIAELGLAASLSPSRSNGLYNIHLRMKQEALAILTLTC